MKKLLVISSLLLSGIILTGCTKSANESSNETPAINTSIVENLTKWTNDSNAGPNRNYFIENGKASLASFKNVKPTQPEFTKDSQGRSSVAKATLTYKEFEASKGSRQGTPLDPPNWPQNFKAAITYSLTSKTYNGYMYNRSHSIADSLLGAASYTSKYNFTTGTRSQNVGADQNGGMRYAEELVENFWRANKNDTNLTVNYQVTPIYKDTSEIIPRGSVIDIVSSDNKLNKEVVVINSAEGYKINYVTGTADKF